MATVKMQITNKVLAEELEKRGVSASISSKFTPTGKVKVYTYEVPEGTDLKKLALAKKEEQDLTPEQQIAQAKVVVVKDEKEADDKKDGKKKK